jgi:hypothetical protein
MIGNDVVEKIIYLYNEVAQFGHLTKSQLTSKKKVIDVLEKFKRFFRRL